MANPYSRWECKERTSLDTRVFSFITKGDNLLTVGFSWVVSKDAQSHAHLELLVTQPPFIHQNMAAQCLIRPPYFPLHVYVCVSNIFGNWLCCTYFSGDHWTPDMIHLVCYYGISYVQSCEHPHPEITEELFKNTGSWAPLNPNPWEGPQEPTFVTWWFWCTLGLRLSDPWSSEHS